MQGSSFYPTLTYVNQQPTTSETSDEQRTRKRRLTIDLQEELYRRAFYRIYYPIERYNEQNAFQTLIATAQQPGGANVAQVGARRHSGEPYMGY